MKLISVDVARTTWLFPLSELNPTGKSFTKIFAALIQRYAFKKYPQNLELDAEAKGFIFNNGDFTNREGIEVTIKLSVFNDGLVADCWSSTRDAEDFLKDAMQWLKKEHGLSVPADRTFKTLYLSQLTVSADINLTVLNPKLQGLAEMLSSKTADTGRPNAGFTVGGLTLWPKNWDKDGAPAAFRFEIKAGSAPGEKRYFAAAALPTDAHLELLNEVERLLVA